MAKKQVAVSLRKPPPPADLAALVINAARDAANATVNATPAGPTSDVRELHPTPRVQEVHETPHLDAFVSSKKHAGLGAEPTTPGVRTISVQLPEAVVDRLLAYCRLHERDLNDVVSEIIARHLSAQRPRTTNSLEIVVQWVRAKLSILAPFVDFARPSRA